jgi:hypothetical protein
MRSRPVSEREGWIWRHAVSPATSPPRFSAPEGPLNDAWRQLGLIHSSFRATEQKEYRDLVASLREVEQLFFDNPDLSAYYDEWFGAPSTAPSPQPAAPSSRVRHVVAIQAQFMEDVYFVLQLARFPNALDNRDG